MSDCLFFQIRLAEQKMRQKMMDVAMAKSHGKKRNYQTIRSSHSPSLHRI